MSAGKVFLAYCADAGLCAISDMFLCVWRLTEDMNIYIYIDMKVKVEIFAHDS